MRVGLSFWAIVALVIVMQVKGCASSRQHVSLESPSLAEVRGTESQADRIREAAQHIKIGYGGQDGRKMSIEDRIRRFNDLGFNASYYAAQGRRRLYLNKYPELFLISRPRSNRVTVQFIGTNSGLDWVQNISARIYEDKKDRKVNPHRLYIPKAHGGFRSGAIDLMNSKFFTQSEGSLEWHVKKFQVRKNDADNVDIVLTGHSLGAALAIVSANAFDGYLQSDGIIERKPEWKYRVKNLYLFATPYTLFYGEYGPDGEEADSPDYERMVELYGEKTFNVIRDDDVIPRMYGPWNGDYHLLRHFGQYVRISHDGQASLVRTEWKNNAPHAIDTYIQGLESLTF